MIYNSFQENLTNQLNNIQNRINVCTRGKIIDIIEQTQGLYEVELKEKYIINNQVIQQKIICSVIKNFNSQQPLKKDDEVLIIYTDYNTQTSGTIDIKNTLKHTANNGIIIGHIIDYNDDNNKNYIIQTREEEPLMAIIGDKMEVTIKKESKIESEDGLNIKFKKDIVCETEGKFTFKNQQVNLFTEWNTIATNLQQAITTLNTILTTDLTTGQAATAMGPAPVTFATLAASATQLNTSLTNINTSCSNIKNLLKQ